MKIIHKDERERSPWFPASVEPAQPGVYECEWEEDTRFPQGPELFFNRWDGKQWHYGMSSPERHVRDFWSPVPHSDQTLKRWRGLASNPMTAGHTSK